VVDQTRGGEQGAVASVTNLAVGAETIFQTPGVLLKKLKDGGSASVVFFVTVVNPNGSC